MNNKLLLTILGDIEAIVSHHLPWERLSGRQVLVTGASGFLGSYFVRTLLSLHRLGKVSMPLRVLAMVRDTDRAAARFDDLLQEPGFQLMQWDLKSIAVPDIRRSEYVIHAASQASPRFYGIDPVGTILPNAVGTAALLEALRQENKAEGLLFVSSSEVYGTVVDDVSLTETHYGVVDPTAVRACYAESKRLGEALCVAWHQQYGIPTYIVRPFHTYGPGLLPEDGRVFSDFAFNVIRGQNIVMKGDGSARRAFCYVSDAVAGFFSVLLKGTPGLPYNVANPAAELSVLELAELLVGLYPGKGLVIERRNASDGTNYVPSTYVRLIPDVARLVSLGWCPSIAPGDGFRRMIEAYQ